MKGRHVRGLAAVIWAAASLCALTPPEDGMCVASRR